MLINAKLKTTPEKKKFRRQYHVKYSLTKELI
jgi:hypothetical protein